MLYRLCTVSVLRFIVVVCVCVVSPSPCFSVRGLALLEVTDDPRRQWQVGTLWVPWMLVLMERADVEERLPFGLIRDQLAGRHKLIAPLRQELYGDVGVEWTAPDEQLPGERIVLQAAAVFGDRPQAGVRGALVAVPAEELAVGEVVGLPYTIP